LQPSLGLGGGARAPLGDKSRGECPASAGRFYYLLSSTSVVALFPTDRRPRFKRFAVAQSLRRSHDFALAASHRSTSRPRLPPAHVPRASPTGHPVEPGAAEVCRPGATARFTQPARSDHPDAVYDAVSGIVRAAILPDRRPRPRSARRMPAAARRTHSTRCSQPAPTIDAFSRARSADVPVSALTEASASRRVANAVLAAPPTRRQRHAARFTPLKAGDYQLTPPAFAHRRVTSAEIRRECTATRGAAANWPGLFTRRVTSRLRDPGRTPASADTRRAVQRVTRARAVARRARAANGVPPRRRSGSSSTRSHTIRPSEL